VSKQIRRTQGEIFPKTGTVAMHNDSLQCRITLSLASGCLRDGYPAGAPGAAHGTSRLPEIVDFRTAADNSIQRRYPSSQMSAYDVNRFVVISGCSGGGKSTLLIELGRRGYATVEEPGRRIVKEERLGEAADVGKGFVAGVAALDRLAPLMGGQFGRSAHFLPARHGPPGLRRCAPGSGRPCDVVVSAHMSPRDLKTQAERIAHVQGHYLYR
jgi:AAA domain